MTGGGLRAATLRRHARLLSVGEQYLHGGVGTDTVQRCQRGRRTGCRVLRASFDRPLWGNRFALITKILAAERGTRQVRPRDATLAVAGQDRRDEEGR
jgi:hypothetical protein